MKKEMKTISVNLDFEHDEFNESFPFTVTVPADTANNEVEDAIDQALEAREESDPDREEIIHIPSLLDEICKKHGWTWRKFKFDIDMSYS